jgi:hypothetical protein
MIQDDKIARQFIGRAVGERQVKRFSQVETVRIHFDIEGLIQPV